MNDRTTLNDHDLLLRLDESINGEETGLKALVERLNEKLDRHFDNHKRERNGIIAAMASAIIAVVTALLALFAM